MHFYLVATLVGPPTFQKYALLTNAITFRAYVTLFLPFKCRVCIKWSFPKIYYMLTKFVAQVNF